MTATFLDTVMAPEGQLRSHSLQPMQLMAQWALAWTPFSLLAQGSTMSTL